MQKRCTLLRPTSNFPRPPSTNSHCPRTVVDVTNNNPRDGRSRGFKPTVQSDRDILNCAGCGVLVDVATFSAVVRAAFVIESVTAVGVKMLLSFSSQGVKTKYSKLRLKRATRLTICPSEELTNLTPTEGVESFS
jgi:hypothetical protein